MEIIFRENFSTFGESTCSEHILLPLRLSEFRSLSLSLVENEIFLVVEHQRRITCGGRVKELQDRRPKSSAGNATPCGVCVSVFRRERFAELEPKATRGDICRSTTHTGLGWRGANGKGLTRV